MDNKVEKANLVDDILSEMVKNSPQDIFNENIIYNEVKNNNNNTGQDMQLPASNSAIDKTRQEFIYILKNNENIRSKYTDPNIFNKILNDETAMTNIIRDYHNQMDSQNNRASDNEHQYEGNNQRIEYRKNDGNEGDEGDRGDEGNEGEEGNDDEEEDTSYYKKIYDYIKYPLIGAISYIIFNMFKSYINIFMLSLPYFKYSIYIITFTEILIVFIINLLLKLFMSYFEK